MPEIQPGQGGGATRQEPRRPHTQLPFLLELQLRLSTGADGAILVAAVEGREGRDPLQRVGDGRPPVDPQVVPSGPPHAQGGREKEGNIEWTDARTVHGWCAWTRTREEGSVVYVRQIVCGFI